MRLPTFSRQAATDTPTEERPVAGTSSVAKPDETTTRTFRTPGGPAVHDKKDGDEGRATIAPRETADTVEQHRVKQERVTPTGPKPRASLLATLGLILAVVGAMLVLSGPLLGYGLGVAVLALILSLSGIHATGRRHVAGKSDALIGMVLSLAAIVIGVLALTGSLAWLGTDVQPVNTAREWLDAQFVNRF
ncbi:hypothetical protein [Actinoplanes sp. NBRC 103695]|uniref:hypothetical protein n=1 Tax=Actinoplanes sp. NBRC 103695 TaxID=3032202 RepID=UPI0024A5F35A|nr:hypothetical protein [Actinoplanes sp. NBRC 103695]GLY98916.1 hypothetical protein Acsp02_61700 [Actinoplanes sp. NBRC 103695]